MVYPQKWRDDLGLRLGLIITLDPNWYTPKKIYAQKAVTATLEPRRQNVAILPF
jgi:hypothetical protein